MRPERRLLFLYTPLVQMGGAERNFLEEVRQFRSHGVPLHAVTFTLGSDPSVMAAAETAGIELIPCNGPWSATTALRRFINQQPPRLLIVHTSPPLAYLATLGTGVPYVLYLNDPPFYQGYPENQVIYSWRYSRLVKETIQRSGPRYADFLGDVSLGPVARAQVEARALLMSLAVRKARAVINWSDRAAEEVKMIYGVDSIVLKGCIPDALRNYVPRSNIRELLGVRDNRRIVLTVSRLDTIKRVDLLIRAFDILKRTHPEAVLVIVGIGRDESRLRALASELGTADVVFAGYVPDETLWDFYATSDVFVTPALADFNIAPYEALALGCRVIWSSEMDPDESLRRSSAVVTVEPDVAEFAAAIARTFSMPEPAMSDITPYLWSHRYERLAALFNSAAQPTTDGQRELR
jgi:glycosyltransferase involved in cell wall biosynthesis